MDPEEENQSTSLGQVAQEFKCQVADQMKDVNDINEEYYDEEYYDGEYPESHQSQSPASLAQVCIRKAESEVGFAFADMRTDLKYYTFQTGTIEFRILMRWLEDTWEAIVSDLYYPESYYEDSCQGSISDEKNSEKSAKVAEVIEEMRVSRCRLDRVLETALNEAKDGLFVLYDQKQPQMMSIEVDTVLRQLEIAQKSISDQLNYPPIDTLPDLVLLHIFRYLSLYETIHFRRVCPRFQTLLDEKCRSLTQITSLKLFDCYENRFTYISSVCFCQLSQPTDDRLHLYHDGRADDLTIQQEVFDEKPEVIHQIANQFQAIKTLVFVNFADKYNLLYLSVFSNLTTLVIPGITDYLYLFTSLSSLTSLCRLYLIRDNSRHYEYEVDNLEAAAIVLGRLTCLVTPYLSKELVPMLSVEMKQLKCDFFQDHWYNSLIEPIWEGLCNRLSALTYLHVPNFIAVPNHTLFRLLMSLPNLVELSLDSFSVLPSISQIREHSLKLRTVKKIHFQTLTDISIELITTLFPELQVLLYNKSTINEIQKNAFAQFCVQFEQTNIKIEHNSELLEKMTGPHWKEYKDWEKKVLPQFDVL